jgi:hypothetical protein
MDFFVNQEDLTGWVKHQESYSDAANKIFDLVGKSKEQDIMETCKAIYETEDETAANVLFGVLAQHNLTSLKKEASNQEVVKEAQSQTGLSRQRNNWVRGNRNKFNRVVDGFNEGTPWRIDRDKFYNFTHYYTDAISFDEDPKNVYSGEAIWRMYVMDKFTREYQNKEGKWVGGYINDRFFVFPTAGTPDNPDAPRDGGNQMGLAPGEKSRKPRPHQYSVERRLEEARGNKTEDIELFASKSHSMVKLASKKDATVENDKVYNIFRDVLDMREAGISYDVMIDEVSKHYDASVMGVAQIDKMAQTLKTKHSGVAYEIVKTAIDTQAPQKKTEIIPNASYIIKNQRGVPTVSGTILPKDTEIKATGKPNEFLVAYHPSDPKLENSIVQANVTQNDVIQGGGATETGLEETSMGVEQQQSVNQVQQNKIENPVDNPNAPQEAFDAANKDFSIDEVASVGNK